MVAQGFEWYDYLLFSATLAVSIGIGLYYGFAGSKQKTTKEYLQGNRNLGVIPVALSMFMSYISAILVLGNTAELYNYGPNQWIASIGSSMAYISTSLFFIPLFFPLDITSSFEYLELRFKSKAVKLTGTLLLMLSQILYMGIAMFSPATALDAVIDFPTWASIIATGVAATIYTTLGGIKAVIWTDVFQCVVMLGGVIAVLIAGSEKLGGFDNVWDTANDWGRLTFVTDFNPLVRISVWSVLVGRFVSSTQTVGTGQTSVQRYCALPTQTKAKLSVLFNIPMMLIIYTLTTMVGIVVFAFYAQRGCDPLRTGEVSSANQLLPYFIVNDLGIPALPGLFVAVLFSGALSTLSSSLNSLSAVAWKDLLEWKFHYFPEEKKALCTKVLVVLFGAISIGFAFLVEVLGGHVLQASQSFVSGVAGPLLGLFVLGGFFPCANWIGAVAGAWSGLIFSMVCTIGNYVEEPYEAVLPTPVYNCSMYGFNETDLEPIKEDDPEVFALFRISYMWFASLGTCTCVAVGFFVSLATGPNKPKDVDPRLVIPVFDRFLCCLPKSVRQRCWCGIDFDEAELDEEGNYIDLSIKGEKKEEIEMEEEKEKHESPNGVINRKNRINPVYVDGPPHLREDAPINNIQGQTNNAYSSSSQDIPNGGSNPIENNTPL